MHRAMITAKNTTENTTGDTPERLGEIAISKVVAEVRGIATMGPMHRMMTHISTSAGTVPTRCSTASLLPTRSSANSPSMASPMSAIK